MLEYLTSISPSSVLAVLALAILVYWWMSREKFHNLPPMPCRPWPIIGHLGILKKNPLPQFRQWREELGDVFMIYMGSRLTVVLNGYDTLKEAHVDNAELFLDKTPMYFEKTIGTVGKGIIQSNHQNWKEHRSFARTLLRKFGMGRDILAHRIQEQTKRFLALLEEKFENTPVDLQPYLNLNTANVISSFVVGRAFPYDHKGLLKFLDYFNFLMRNSDGTSLVHFLPFLLWLPGDYFGAKAHTQATIDSFKYTEEFLLKNKTEVPGEDLDNFISEYQREQAKREESGKGTNLSHTNLVRGIQDLFFAGTETTTNTIYWFLLFMLHYPHVQEKMFKEIESVVGLDRLPFMEDKDKLVYTNAAICEAQRRGSLTPLSVPRTINKTCTFRGYTLPKGTTILTNLDSALKEKSVWGEDIDEYNPDRFINPDGTLRSPDEFVPFSLGKRVCLGEPIARTEMYINISSLVQRYRILPEDPKNLPPIAGDFGIVCAPYHFKVILQRRK